MVDDGGFWSLQVRLELSTRQNIQSIFLFLKSCRNVETTPFETLLINALRK
ncbi:hypothetical protein [Neobacillus vireti]|uniref:hypothetical protein n=1 Tax=Neobacillus vireti TaxID=220686 RepID=UPI002FFE2F42